jgi:hypothetical protein
MHQTDGLGVFGTAALVTTALIGAIVFAEHLAGRDPLRCKKSESAAQTNHGAPRPTMPNVGASKPAYQTPDCRVPNSDKEDDLCQQRRMAQGADESACIARWQFWASLFGLGGLICTLLLGIRANLAASQNANAAVAAVDLARKTYVAEHRVWLKVYPVSANSVEFKGDKIRVSITIEAENIGNHPAANVHLGGSAFRARGFAINRAGVKRFVEREKRMLSMPGSMLMPGDRTRLTFTGDAETDPDAEVKGAQQEAAGVPLQNRPIALSAAFGVFYKSAAVDEWHHTAHALFLRRLDNKDFSPESGDVTAENLKMTVLPYDTDFT